MATRRQCDGFTKSCYLRKQLGTFLFPLYCILEEKNARCHQLSHEEKTKTTRSDKVASRWPHKGQDGLTNSIRKRNFARPSGNFFTCQRFCAAHEVAAEPKKVHRRPFDGLRCPHEWREVFTIRAECEHFCHRVSILCQLRDSVTTALWFSWGGAVCWCHTVPKSGHS